jgi:cystathionine beta-lyase/cystathionine gamma-synthase
LKSHPQYEIAKQMKAGGNIVAFEIKKVTRSRALLDKINYVRFAKFRDTRTIVTHPASTTHKIIR